MIKINHLEKQLPVLFIVQNVTFKVIRIDTFFRINAQDMGFVLQTLQPPSFGHNTVVMISTSIHCKLIFLYVTLISKFLLFKTDITYTV